MIIGLAAFALAGCGSPIELPGEPPATPPPPPPPPPPTTVPTVAPPVLVGIPWNVTVTAGDAAVDLSWNLVNGAQAYRVEWESDPEPLLVPPSDTGTVTHDFLATNLRYRYTVTIGSEDTLLSAIPREPPTNAPATVSITPGLRENTLSWSAVTGATEYRIYWSYLPNVLPGIGTLINVAAESVQPTTYTYTHTGLSPETPYYYVVTAVVGTDGESAASAEVQAIPAQVTGGVTATVSQGEVLITWPAGDTASISVARSEVAYVSPFPSFPLTIGDLENDRRHAIRIRPLFSGGLGPSSPTMYAVPKAPADGVPRTVTLSANRGVNTLSWDEIVGAAAYEVTWFAQDVDGSPIAGTRTVSAPPFRHAGLRMCSVLGDTCPTYTYRVRVAQSTGIAAEVAAQSADLRPTPPIITNNDFVIITGVKPVGSRVEINGVVTVPFDYETGWTATLPLTGAADRLFTFRMVAIDADGLVSTETTYEILRDTAAPAPPQSVTLTACDPATDSPRGITLSGTKDAESAVFRVMEPTAPDQTVVGATGQTAWSGVIELEDQPATISLVAKDAAGNVSSPAISIALSACP